MAPLPMDRDESTVMGCDIEIYQTVIADADSDGPGSDRGRAQERTRSDTSPGDQRPAQRRDAQNPQYPTGVSSTVHVARAA